MQFHPVVAVVLLVACFSAINPINCMFVKGRRQLVDNVYYIANRGEKPLSPVIFGKYECFFFVVVDKMKNV